jgi:hypothetical protein
VLKQCACGYRIVCEHAWSVKFLNLTRGFKSNSFMQLQMELALCNGTCTLNIEGIVLRIFKMENDEVSQTC